MQTVWILYLKSRGPQLVEKVFTSEALALSWINRKIAMDNAETEKRNAKRKEEYPKLPANRFAPLWSGPLATNNSIRWERTQNRGQDLEYYLLSPMEVTVAPPTQTYRIPVEWTMTGFITVTASSLQEAVEVADDPETGLPEGTYIDGSFRIIHEELEDWNN